MSLALTEIGMTHVTGSEFRGDQRSSHKTTVIKLAVLECKHRKIRLPEIAIVKIPIFVNHGSNLFQVSIKGFPKRSLSELGS